MLGAFDESKQQHLYFRICLRVSLNTVYSYSFLYCIGVIKLDVTVKIKVHCVRYLYQRVSESNVTE